MLLAVLLMVSVFVTMFMIVRSFCANTADLPVEVPNLVGNTLDSAKKTLSEYHLYSYVEEEYNDKVPAGTVISQNPEAGYEMKQGQTVTLVVSLGPEMAEVPDVCNLSYEEAKKRIEDAGLAVGEIAYTDSDLPEGTVVEQSPAAGGELGPKELVSLTLSRGEVPATMPNLLGMEGDCAIAYLNENGFLLGEKEYIDSQLMEAWWSGRNQNPESILATIQRSTYGSATERVPAIKRNTKSACRSSGTAPRW
jgi:serine/threonine-protein kinase